MVKIVELIQIIKENPKATAIMVIFLLGFINKKINKMLFRGKELKELGIYREIRDEEGNPIKIEPEGKYHGDHVKITKYNHQSIRTIEQENIKNALGAIYHKKVESVEVIREKGITSLIRQATILIKFEVMPKYLSMKEVPKTIYPNIYFGKQREDIILNLENMHGILVLSRAGGGKSNLARTLIQQFPQHDKIIIDDKGTDYLDIIKQEDYFNPTDIEEFKRSVEKIEQYVKECETYKIQLKEKMIQVSHWNMLSDKPTPKLIVLDEFAQYMKLNKGGEKEREELKTRLIRAIEKILQLYRVSGTVILALSQSSNASDYDLSFNNFAIRIYSKQNAQQSTNLIGSHILNDPELFQGTFYLQSPTVETKFKAPLNPLRKKEQREGK